MSDNINNKAKKLGIKNIKKHIFLCCDQTKDKCCKRDVSIQSWNYLKNRLSELKLSQQGKIYRTKADCPKTMFKRSYCCHLS